MVENHTENNKVLSRDNQRTVLVIVVLVIVIGLWSLFHFVYASPANVFHRMLSNSLDTSSYTKTISNLTNGQSSKQVISVETGAINRVIENETLSVPGYSKGIIKIQNIGTPTTDYSRYLVLKTHATDKDGIAINYSPIIGVWGSSTTPGASNGKLFNSAVLDIIPMGNVNPALKKQFLDYLEKYKVYSYSGNVARTTIDGKNVFSYTVSIKPYYLDYYVYQFANAIGLTHGKVAPIGKIPSAQPTKKVQFYIDIATSQLIGIKLLGTNESYIYSSYGANLPISIPTKAIKLTELETRISNLISS